MRGFALIILILLYFDVIEGGFSRPRGLRSLRSHHCCAFYGQIGHQEGGQVDFLDAVLIAQDFFAQSPLPFCSDITVQSRKFTASQNLRQPTAALEQALGFRRHLNLFQMVEQLRGDLPLRLTNGLKDARLGNPVQIVVRSRLPACRDHVEIDGLGYDLGLRQAAGQPAGRDACAVRVYLLVERVDPEAQAMNRPGFTGGWFVQ
ncbi:MAG: hypothetical protein CFE33_18890 [Pseudorhodobacter sp. PARRP1]|nr:MAG: hypothetical protein CFE33_18890 [Pseudorhodobacter sp. PARRP1]